MKSMLRNVQSSQNIIMFRDAVLLCHVMSCCVCASHRESLFLQFVYLSLSLVHSSRVSFFLVSQPFLLPCFSSAFFGTV